MVDGNSSKLLSCEFHDDVLCSHRKYEGFGIMDRCLRCRYYRRFMREIAEEDERVMDEIDEIQKRFEHG